MFIDIDVSVKMNPDEALFQQIVRECENVVFLVLFLSNNIHILSNFIFTGKDYTKNTCQNQY